MLTCPELYCVSEPSLPSLLNCAMGQCSGSRVTVTAERGQQ